MKLRLVEVAGGVLLAVKVVPGAGQDEIAGLLGDRLKVWVSAPPERGKANNAVCAVVASALRVRPRDIEVVEGESSPRKTLRVMGLDALTVATRLSTE